MKWKGRRLLAMALTGILLAGCGAAGQVDDYATNEGSTQEASTKTTGTESGGISKDKIKVGVLHLSDPAEGSGYTYTHDLGIQAMQQNLGLSDEQIDRKINVDDSDKEATEKRFRSVWMTDAILFYHQLGIYGCHGGDGGKISGYIFCTWNRIQKQRKEFCKLFRANLSGKIFKWNRSGNEYQNQ